MNKQLLIIFTFLLISINGYSQPDCTTDPPLPPVMSSVSVAPESGNIELEWTLSPSTDIAAYILYSYDNGDGLPIDTIWDPAADSYNLTSTVTKYKSSSFVVAAMRLPRCTSILSNALSTIYTVASIDTCHKKIDIHWNNYISFPKNVINYSLLASINGGSYNEIAVINSENNSYSINDFELSSEYCLIIKANLEDGSFSSSNKTCIYTKMQRPPQWINADQATVTEDESILLSFTVDPLAETYLYSLEKKTERTGSFIEVSRINSGSSTILYEDDEADIKDITYYRLSAINNCNIPVISSNTASNMVLRINESDDKIRLLWNPYQQWNGLVSSYNLFLDTGSGFELMSNIQPPDTIIEIRYAQIVYQITSNKVCFYISAIEKDNPYGVIGESKSSIICTEPDEIITVPNVFTPNSGTTNAWFKPALSFTPGYYQLSIQDRRGKVLFETNDFNEPWDGSGSEGFSASDVCLWFLKVTSPSGRNISKTGTITVLRKQY